MSFARRLRRNKQVTEGVCDSCGRAASAVRRPGGGFDAYHADPICPAWKALCEKHGGELHEKPLTLAEYEEMVRKVEAN